MVKLQQGDVIKISFNPQKGHEQAGYRPAVVIGNKLMNERMTVVFICPVTHTERNNPFHYELKNYDFVDGFVMCEQMKSFDVKARTYQKSGHLSEADISEIIDRVQMLIEKE